MSQLTPDAETLVDVLKDMPCDLSVEEIVEPGGPDPFSVDAIDRPGARPTKS